MDLLSNANIKTILKFDTLNAFVLPFEFQNDDVRFSDSFAEYFIEHFSKPDDIVFDPFAGFGTTLYAAEKLGRKAVGVEFLSERAAYIRQNMNIQDTIICGSSLNLNQIDLPPIGFSLTSPPYMQNKNHPEYPFAGYEITGQSYGDYLRDISDIFFQLKSKLKPDAYVVIEVSNLRIGNAFTPLAWDIAKRVGEVLPFEQEIIIEWQSDFSPTYGFGYDHSYALVFKNCGDNDVKIPENRLLNYGEMTDEQFHAEIEKGYADLAGGKTSSAKDVAARLRLEDTES